MKRLLIICCLLVTSLAFSQEEWGDVDKNKVTMKEIAPVWPGCEGKSGSGIDSCFKNKLSQHIGKNFRYPPEAYKKNEQGKVIVVFFVNEQGTIDIESVSGGSDLLQKEAKRNISAIPKMTKPGMMGGKPRAIKYTVPFNFKTGK